MACKNFEAISLNFDTSVRIYHETRFVISDHGTPLFADISHHYQSAAVPLAECGWLHVLRWIGKREGAANDVSDERRDQNRGDGRCL